MPSVKGSFFDDSRSKSNFDFVKPTPKHQKYIAMSPTVVTRLVSQALHSSSPRTGIYALHGRLLAYYTSEVSCFPEMVLDLNRSRLKAFSPNKTHSTYGFRVTKNGKSFDFYSTDKEIFEAWITGLKQVCVLINFHEEYKAIRSIGSGSFAKVYLVESKTTKKFFAAKAFNKEQVFSSVKESARLSIFNEIDLMRQMDHPHIIKLYEIYETDHSIYLVMELIHSKSLRDTLKSTSFKKDPAQTKIVEMIHSLLMALAYLASKGIVHRDIKPANILTEKGQKLKIIDLGLATPYRQRKFIFRKCGTPGYIAPEIFKYSESIPSTAFDDRCDVFSAGCVFYYMLFGTQIFDALDGAEALFLNKTFTMESDPILKIHKEIANPLSKINKEALDLLLQLIEADPKKRISAEQALNHPYFLSLQKPSIAIAIKESTAFSIPKQSHAEHSPSIAIKNIEENNIFVLKEEQSDPSVGNRSDKDSLYLDTKWSNSNGKIDTVGYASGGNSLFQNGGYGGSSSNVETAPAFEKSGAQSERSESPQPHYRGRGSKGPMQHGQSFLKAAIMKNMSKNVDVGPEEQKSEERLPPSFGRRFSDNTLIKSRKERNEALINQSDDSSDTEEIGIEENDAEGNLHRIVQMSKVKQPSKMVQTSRRFYTMICKK